MKKNERLEEEKSHLSVRSLASVLSLRAIVCPSHKTDFSKCIYLLLDALPSNRRWMDGCKSYRADLQYSPAGLNKKHLTFSIPLFAILHQIQVNMD